MKASLKVFFIELAEIAVMLVAVLIIRFYIFQPFLVSGESMLPNFRSGDYLIIDELSQKFNKVSRGEVIVFRPPMNQGTFFIKRVIGLPGETVEIKDGGIAIYNAESPRGFALPEPYLKNPYTPGNMRVTLGPTEYFVLGDNRAASFDSRRWGPLPGSDIVGGVLVRLFPLNRISLLHE